METIGMKRTGGARIGWVNATWPFATLSANRQQLLLNASLIGKYSFTPDQVVGIEKYTTIPVLGWGIKIKHNVATYPKNIIFWCFGNPVTLIDEIRSVGFRGVALPDSVPQNAGIAVRWQALIAMVVIWNALFILDEKFFRHDNRQTGPLVFVALLMMFIGSTGIYKSQLLKSLIMKPGRKPEEIKQWLSLFSLISGLMCVGFALEALFS